MDQTSVTCPACAREMIPAVTAWTRRCENCGHWTAALAPDFSAGVGLPTAADDDPLSFLDTLRRKNFTTILDRLGELRLPGTLLDVGCGSGLFLELAAKRGHVATGIEPKPEMATAAQRAGRAVRAGLFPTGLGDGERFATIVFNDVLEHIGDLGGTLAACREHLLPDGVLVINVPNARGALYRLAVLLRRSGIRGPFERLWQTMFYSPHLHYFTPKSLVAACNDHDFAQLGEVVRLEAVTVDGLWARISADPGASLLRRAVSFCFVAAALPLLRVLPSDAMVGYFEPRM